MVSTRSKALLAAAGAAVVSAECTWLYPATSNTNTCTTISKVWGMSVAQFQYMNPTVDCSQNLVVGQNYCLEWDGGLPTVTSSSSSAAAATTTSKPTSTAASSTTFKTSTTTTAGSSGPSPTQDGIAANCNNYYKADGSIFCYDIAAKYGISLDNFYAWNPAVGTNCGALWSGYYYCVGTSGSTTVKPSSTASATATGSPKPSPTQDGLSATCNNYYLADGSIFCYDIAAKYGITLDNFYAWNPAVGTNCGSLWSGYYYCVGNSATSTAKPTTTTTAVATGPSPTQTGIISSCKTYYLADGSIFCYDIAAKYGISLDNFYAWNPAVGNTCANLWKGYYYCVGI
ncbi:hypothetical protein GQ53DRAFT_790479 [Thozetella sp. PMI_491]|nr:hypothetical protein GQ53DRAFT_790479 [Thozetella sp. PMI_491]